MSNLKQLPQRHAQRGAVLFVALVFLVLLTLLGLSATGTSLLQERMIGGTRSAQLAVMGAESAMRSGEFKIWIAPQASASGAKLTLYCTDGAASGGCYAPQTNGTFSSTVQNFRTAPTWTTASNAGGTTYTTSLTSLGSSLQSAQLAAQPTYIVQMVGPDLPPGSRGAAGGSLQQQLGNTPDNQTKYIYSIIARSVGGSTNVVRVTESTFAGIRAQY